MTMNACVVLTDIEGTTTSISFVKDVLFPYAKEHTEAFLASTWDEARTQTIVGDLLKLDEYKEYLNTAKNDPESKELTARQVADFVKYLIDRDLKVGPLKTLQGLVWEKGYANGCLKGHVFPDVPKAFKRWKEAGLSIAIYSSGSVKAQQLLFGQTELGNLLPYISTYFDTGIGHKQERQSYENIAKALDVPAGDIVFLTDITQEADAAQRAGMKTVILSRPGNLSLTDDQKAAFVVMNDFDALKIGP